MLFKEISNSSEKCFLGMEKVQCIQGIEMPSLLLLYLNIYFISNEAWEGNSAFRGRTCYFFWNCNQDTCYIEIVNIIQPMYDMSHFLYLLRKNLEWWWEAVKYYWNQWSALHHSVTWSILFQVTWTVSCDSSHILFRADCIHFICWFCILMSRYLRRLVLI